MNVLEFKAFDNFKSMGIKQQAMAWINKTCPLSPAITTSTATNQRLKHVHCDVGTWPVL